MWVFSLLAFFCAVHVTTTHTSTLLRHETRANNQAILSQSYPRIDRSYSHTLLSHTPIALPSPNATSNESIASGENDIIVFVNMCDTNKWTQMIDKQFYDMKLDRMTKRPRSLQRAEALSSQHRKSSSIQAILPHRTNLHYSYESLPITPTLCLRHEAKAILFHYYQPVNPSPSNNLAALLSIVRAAPANEASDPFGFRWFSSLYYAHFNGWIKSAIACISLISNIYGQHVMSRLNQRIRQTSISGKNLLSYLRTSSSCNSCYLAICLLFCPKNVYALSSIERYSYLAIETTASSSVSSREITASTIVSSPTSDILLPQYYTQIDDLIYVTTCTRFEYTTRNGSPEIDDEIKSTPSPKSQPTHEPRPQPTPNSSNDRDPIGAICFGSLLMVIMTRLSAASCVSCLSLKPRQTSAFVNYLCFLMCLLFMPQTVSSTTIARFGFQVGDVATSQSVSMTLSLSNAFYQCDVMPSEIYTQYDCNATSYSSTVCSGDELAYDGSAQMIISNPSSALLTIDYVLYYFDNTKYIVSSFCVDDAMPRGIGWPLSSVYCDGSSTKLQYDSFCLGESGGDWEPATLIINFSSDHSIANAESIICGPVIKTESKGPSFDLSIAPTLPSLAPTDPSTNPSYAPSMVPSIDPSIAPTLDPSLSPTDQSANPSYAPAMVPSIDPSLAPTLDPSLAPTIYPYTNQSNPSITTTLNPSLQPSIGPSITPTLNPSLPPTVDPSTNPSYGPSLPPTNDPT
eukprot:32766_1